MAKQKGRQMIETVTTSTPLEDVKIALEATAKEFSFGILGSYKFKNILEGKGFPIEKDITVYELCNPKGAQAVLSDIAAFSIFLPCKISVYEENGQSIITTITIEAMVEAVNPTAKTQEHMQEIYSNLLNLMKSL